ISVDVPTVTSPAADTRIVPPPVPGLPLLFLLPAPPIPDTSIDRVVTVPLLEVIVMLLPVNSTGAVIVTELLPLRFSSDPAAPDGPVAPANVRLPPLSNSSVPA